MVLSCLGCVVASPLVQQKRAADGGETSFLNFKVRISVLLFVIIVSHRTNTNHALHPRLQWTDRRRFSADVSLPTFLCRRSSSVDVPPLSTFLCALPMFLCRHSSDIPLRRFSADASLPTFLPTLLCRHSSALCRHFCATFLCRRSSASSATLLCRRSSVDISALCPLPTFLCHASLPTFLCQHLCHCVSFCDVPLPNNQC